MEVIEIGRLIGGVSAPAILGIIIAAFLKRWVILPGEVTRMEEKIKEIVAIKDERIRELADEKREYQDMVLHAIKIGERVANVADKK